ncbi:osteopetrosis-associated transmembrane protein 1-like isoform X1 [Varroa jacobsoni]|uniref:Osteopetrosis-associated transmembrane protein 1 n=1 Tax=Varroa destructor TaxID=109461 RepID=A0A7M7MEE9_VARDE|nr:osteopetrosis-associated transmembrane protein 1-like isoform X2 [Varroa destructor]XP_022655928.1 osteopetrosis-associated transmembrane protein 1-like isoform X2 [Varroa destructor]XP_022655929.1 osteopetrosis-associated transmembrane protein 1-like isoform X2 [Varroa destructor]XP_022697358.1 osteopetrosis-associated transmembrane protein 1-like isoform X1 [Varroa jacobsoni]
MIKSIFGCRTLFFSEKRATILSVLLLWQQSASSYSGFLKVMVAIVRMLPSGWLSSVGLYCVHLVSLLLCLSALPSVSLGLTPECKEYLKDVAQSSSGFEVCALLCARPFRVCSSCFDDYAFAHNMFVNLKSGRGQVEKNCSEDLVSGDRVSIINRAFTYVTETWESGNCDNCLVVSKSDDIVHFKVAEFAKEFQTRAEQVFKCIDSHIKNESRICTDCLSSFSNLSNFYHGLVKKYEEKLCMDIIDIMNTTRVKWSDYGCSHVYGLEPEVCLYAWAMVIITIVFYFFARFSQKPRDAEILEGRTMREHISKMSVDSNSFRDQQELIPHLQPLFTIS